MKISEVKFIKKFNILHVRSLDNDNEQLKSGN